MTKLLKRRWMILLGIVLSVIALLAYSSRSPGVKHPEPVAKAALTVTITQPQKTQLPLNISANGNIAAWQEASIGTEATGLRLAEVRVNVGDVVKRGQVLATFATGTAEADVAQALAAVAEAKAALAEAAVNAERARKLQPGGIMSAQQVNQYLTAEQTAEARLAVQQAAVEVKQLRLQQTRVVAPDHGVISSRNATEGAVPPGGQELFRIIRQGRLEWRAEVSSADLALLKPGMRVSVTSTNGIPIKGTLRKIAPTVDVQTRNGLVYVDLPSPGNIKAGMFAHGDFDLGSSQALTLPQSAVLQRDGFSYVLRLDKDSRVSETKVSVGRRVGERIEITGGLDAAARVVAAGGGFLADGDTVRVVDVAGS